ncbi:MAG: HAD family hydrolase [Candidatus Faecivicinus sp.]
MLRNVIFDFGNVLYGYDPDTLLGFCFHTEEELNTARRVIYRHWQALDEGSVDYDAYVEESLSMLPERLHEPARKFFYNWFRFEYPIEGAWALVALLKARGYGVYLLSNAPTVFADALDSFPILKLFDGLVVSAPIRRVKPNADIFEYTLERFGLNASESLFVDDMAVNVEGARRCGLYGYVFNGDAKPLLEYIESLF